MSKPSETPMGPDGRSLSILRPEATLSSFPATVTSGGGAVTSTAVPTGQAVFIYVEDFEFHLRISQAGTAATTSDLKLNFDTLYTFALAPGDKVSILGTNGTGATAHVWEAKSRP